MDAESDLKAKMIRQRADLSRPETNANAPATRSSTNRFSQIMSEHQDMMTELALDINKFPFKLAPDEVKFYEKRRREFKERMKVKQQAPTNYDEIITEAENARRMQDSRTERDALLESVTDIYNLVNLIVAKYENLGSAIKC